MASDPHSARQRTGRTVNWPLAAYNLALSLGLCAGLPFMLPLWLLSEKRRRTVPYRLGLRRPPLLREAGLPPPLQRRPIWVHTLSVGEAQSAERLVAVLAARYGRSRLYLTASTQTGYATARRLYAGQVARIGYFPYDLPVCVAAAGRRIDPALVVLIESDIWPNFMRYHQRRGTPALLVNARLSKRTFSGYNRFSFVTRPMLRAFTAICAQTPADAGRFMALGAAPGQVTVSGNLKFDQALQPPPEGWIARQSKLLGIEGRRQVIIAGSTHPGEEEVVVEACRRMRRHQLDPLLVLVPRDPKRGRRIVDICRAAGLTAQTYSQLSHKDAGGPCDVVVVDALGILRDLYALADVVFIGGSLVPLGGHNPLEAAVHAKPVLFGPHMNNFDQISRLFLSGGAALQVTDAGTFAKAAERWLTDTSFAAETGRRGRQVMAAHRGAVEKTLRQIERVLPRA